MPALKRVTDGAEAFNMVIDIDVLPDLIYVAQDYRIKYSLSIKEKIFL
jgi:hypothetical protein